MFMQAGLQSDRQPAAMAGGDIDLGVLRDALWRRKSLILGLTLLAAGIAFIAVNLVTPRYKSEARVLIEMRESIFLRPDAEKTFERGTTVDQEAVTSQVQLILSRDLAREVINKLKLGDNPEFDPLLRVPSVWRTVLGFVGIIRDPLGLTHEERVYRSYYERLSAFQVEKSRVIAIEFESQSPELAAQVANTVAETYLRFQQAAKQEQTRAASSWLSGEIERLRTNLAQAEAKVEQYRSKTNLFIGNNNTTLSNQQLGDFNGQLAAARAQKADAEAKAKLIRDALKAGAPIEFSEIANSDLIRRLSEQRVTLRAQLAEQSSTLLDQHPRIKELRAQIADLERQMRGEAERLARSLENDAKLASSRVDALSSTLDALKRQAVSSNEQDVQLRALERDAKSQRDLLESYLAKYREASARDNIGAAAPDARIIWTAAVSTTPAWPKKVPTVLVAALATFVLSSAIILSSALLRLAPLPLGEAGEGGRRITVIGAGRNAGTTMMAIALARSLAARSRVVLVECALASPNLSVIASDPRAPGLSELVQGTASFGQIITRDRHSRAHLILAGRAAIEGAALMQSERLSIAVEALARSYDHVIIDAGAAADLPLDRFASLAPRAVLVATDLGNAAAAIMREHLLEAGFVNVSVVADAPLPGSETPANSQAAA